MPKHRRRAIEARMGGNGGQADAREAIANDRAERIAKGIGMIRSGETWKFSANSVGLPESTLAHHYMKTLGPEAKNRDEARRDSEARIEAYSAAVAEGSFSSMARDLEVDATHPFLEPKDKAMYAQAAARSMERLRGRHGTLEASAGAGWGEWLAKLQDTGGQASVKIEVEASPHVVDLTPNEPEER